VKENALSSVFKYNGSYMAELGTTQPNSESHEARFLAAFDEYSDALFRHAFLRISDRERAVDIVHDTFAKVWTYIRQGYQIENFRPFLYKVLNNLIIDESLDAILEIEGVDEGAFDELSESTAETLAATIDGKQAFSVLESLPDVYREVLILRFVDGLGPKEIANLIEESENVVSVRLHRGLKLLRQTIEAKEKAIEAARTKTKPSKPSKSKIK
jgi:RNA polymerase sigma-70 factor, ECF subfamily